MRRRPGDAGSVTAELALGMPALALGLGLVLGTAVVGTAAVRAQLAAGAAARAAARGEDEAGVRAAASAASGPAAEVTVTTATSAGGDALVRVVVHRAVVLPVPGHPSLAVSAASSALLEAAGTDGPDGPWARPWDQR